MPPKRNKNKKNKVKEKNNIQSDHELFLQEFESKKELLCNIICLNLVNIVSILDFIQGQHKFIDIFESAT